MIIAPDHENASSFQTILFGGWENYVLFANICIPLTNSRLQKFLFHTSYSLREDAFKAKKLRKYNIKF
jgi:hypothetical protein